MMASTHDFRSAAAAAFNDLVTQDLLRLEEGERFWKVYCFRSPVDPDSVLEHCLYTKRKPSGRLAMVTFARQTSPTGPARRSSLAVVADLQEEHLDRIVTAIRSETRSAGTICLEIDLSPFPDLDTQRARLAGLGQHTPP